jgi:hypothetical protein
MGNVNAIRRTLSHRMAAAALPILAAACAPEAQPFPDLPRLGVATQMTSRNLCGLGVSPRISIANAPPATALYRLRLTNTDVLFQTPWQSTADATPGGFAEGALAAYDAPCVGDLTISSFYPYQTYRLEVLALDRQSRPLAYGQTLVQVQSVSTTLERERGLAGRQSPAPQVPSVIGPVVDPRTADTIGTFISPALVPQMQGPVYQP